MGRGGVDIDPATTHSLTGRSSVSVKPSKTAGMRRSSGFLVKRQGMKRIFVWLGLTCLLVEGAEGSVGQNIQYPQVCAMCHIASYYQNIWCLTRSRFHQLNTKAYFCTLLLYVHCLYCSPPHNLRQKFLSNQVTQSLFKLCHVCRVTTPFKSLLPEYHRKFESPHIFRPRSPNQFHEVFSGTRN